MYISDNVDLNPEHIKRTDILVENGKITLRIELDNIDFLKYSNVGDDSLLKEIGLRFAKRISELIK
mgnify:CR=1 FL=1